MITARYVYPENGTSFEQERNMRLLKLGQEYEVEDIEVLAWKTLIFLKGIEAIFNSVNFEFYKDGYPYDIFADPDINPYLNDNE